MSNVVPHHTAYGILRRMKGGRRPEGFTILETLIVLAVTGMLFASAVILINGRQHKTQFEQAIRQAHAQIQQVIDEINVGQYSSSPGFTCTGTATGPSLTAAASAEQGTNEGCIFLGKVIQFDVAGTNPEEFRAYTVAGLQRVNGSPTGNEVSSLVEAKPLVVSPVTFPNSQREEKLQYGLTTGRMSYDDGNVSNTIGAVAIVSSLASYDNGNLQSTSQQLNVIPMDGTALDQEPAAAVASMNAKLRTASIDADKNPTNGVQLCFVSGGTQQSGLITIGSNGRQLTATLTIKGNTTCS